MCDLVVKPSNGSDFVTVVILLGANVDGSLSGGNFGVDVSLLFNTSATGAGGVKHAVGPARSVSVPVGEARFSPPAISPGSVTGVQGGDLLEFNFTLQHTNDSSSAGYDVVLDDGALGIGYTLAYVIINGVRVDGMTTRRSNTTVFVLPGPVAPGTVLDIQYGVVVTPKAEAGSTTGQPGGLTPRLSLTYASGPAATALTKSTPFAT